MKKLQLACLLSALSVGSATACDMMAYERVQASPHVHVFEAAEGTTGIVNGNVAAVIGSDAILVVDTGQFLGNARRIAADIRALSPAPVRYIVNTHRDGPGEKAPRGERLRGREALDHEDPRLRRAPAPGSRRDALSRAGHASG